MANVFEQVAVGPLHTPALYSCFLRALISARTDPNANAHGPAAAATSGGQEQQQQQQASGESGVPQDAPVASGSGSSAHAQPNSFANGHVNGHAGGSGSGAGGAAGATADQLLENFAYSGEMGPVADMSTFPPTMAPAPSVMDMNMLSMDSILSADFWDSVLVPGTQFFVRMAMNESDVVCFGVGSSHSLESLSGGFVYGAGGSGLITPRMWMSPLPSGANTPSRGGGEHIQQHLHHAQQHQQQDAAQSQGELGLDMSFSVPQGQTEVGVSA